MTYSYQPAYDYRAKAHYAQVYIESSGKLMHLHDTIYRKDRQQVHADAEAAIAAIRKATK
jgi:hypothetical protein